jgi:hypothetical protein
VIHRLCTNRWTDRGQRPVSGDNRGVSGDNLGTPRLFEIPWFPGLVLGSVSHYTFPRRKERKAQVRGNSHTGKAGRPAPRRAFGNGGQVGTRKPVERSTGHEERSADGNAKRLGNQQLVQPAGAGRGEEPPGNWQLTQRARSGAHISGSRATGGRGEAAAPVQALGSSGSRAKGRPEREAGQVGNHPASRAGPGPGLRDAGRTSNRTPVQPESARGPSISYMEGPRTILADVGPPPWQGHAPRA